MKLNVKYSPKKDAENHINTVYKFRYLKHGRENIQQNLLKTLPPKLQEIIKTAKNEKEAYENILSFLNIWQEHNPEYVEQKIKTLLEHWDKTKNATIKFLEHLYQKPFPFEEITVYLTMVPICPYNYKEKYIYVYAQKSPQQMVSVLIHELNHFMFYYYYPELKEKLGEEKYELLKESLTFFSNPDQAGKPNEEELRKLYSNRSWKNIDEIIAEAANI